MLKNSEIASIFENCADMLQIKGESVHRWMAYRRGAETIREMPRGLAAVAEEGTLTDLPGIGKVLAEKIQELLDTGQLEFYEKLKDEVPLGVLDMMRINGVGPKKAAMFWRELNLTSVQQLEKSSTSG